MSWQGVRRDESLNRRAAKKAERTAPGFWNFRPLVEWIAAQVFALAQPYGIEPKPLYRQGMTRVGYHIDEVAAATEAREGAERIRSAVNALRAKLGIVKEVAPTATT